MSNDLVLSNDGYWHLTLFGHFPVIGQQIKMVRHSNGPWNSQAKRQTKNEGMDAKKTEKKGYNLSYRRNYVHCLQQALWNRAASLGRKVPEQSGPHLSVQNKIHL